MLGRNVSADDYRYGFNTKEDDPELVGTGNGTQDYGMRIYNPALGKFLSVDSLTKDYPHYSPYQFAGNKPIWAVDLDGAEEYYVTDYFNAAGRLYKTEITLVSNYGNSLNPANRTATQTVHRSSVNYQASPTAYYYICTSTPDPTNPANPYAPGTTPIAGTFQSVGNFQTVTVPRCCTS
jgi:RHS repeat-associated protein